MSSASPFVKGAILISTSCSASNLHAPRESIPDGFGVVGPVILGGIGAFFVGKETAGKNLRYDDYLDLRALRELDKEGAFK